MTVEIRPVTDMKSRNHEFRVLRRTTKYEVPSRGLSAEIKYKFIF